MTSIAKSKLQRSVPQNNIAKLRKERGWSQETLGEKLGMKGSNIGRLEDGLRRLDTALLLKLCAIFGVSVDKITYLPLAEANAAKVDPAMLGLVVGWLMDACAEYQIEYQTKQVGKWTSYVYNEICERDLNFDDARSLTFKFAKLHKPKSQS